MFLESVPLTTDFNLTEWRAVPPYTRTLLTELRREVNAYTPDFLHQHDVLTHALDIPPLHPNLVSFVLAFHVLNLSLSLSLSGGGVAEGLPVVLVPQKDPTRCVANHHLSTFGFLGFVLNVVNAVINVANNINNNNNNNNNNDNNNNNNDLNINEVQVTQTATNTNDVRAQAARRLDHLKSMRSSISRHLRSLRRHTRRKRSSDSCGVDVVDEAVLAAAALLDMWGRAVAEEDPWCLAWEMCHTAAALAATSRLAADVGSVGTAAAANMLVSFKEINPEFLIEAAERGAEGVNCTELFSSCSDFTTTTTTTAATTTTITSTTTTTTAAVANTSPSSTTANFGQ
ncbi:M-phase inducer phosphatase-like [Scylla paramamosain]|uniref:M-phase inducer phosphatase-like n=1 Tax=Scylla paramamosain TaxID=85552 RepID=UPI00308297DB